MDRKAQAYRGCMLGLAVGDAMGYAVDRKTLAEIRRDYGPDGLLGYDLVNGYADITSYTQLAAYTACGLLIGSTHGQLQGHMAPMVRYVAAAQREWNQIQHTRRVPPRTACWVSCIQQLHRRLCMDTRLLDALNREHLGTPEEPEGKLQSPASLTAAIPVGLFYAPERMRIPEIGRLGAEVVALTDGEAESFLAGAAAAYVIAGIVQDPDTPLREQFYQAAAAAAAQFGRQFPQVKALQQGVERAAMLSKNALLSRADGMERLVCETGAQALCGAVYACLSCGGDFDTAMITAVNHSGRSAAVGALTGAILGAYLGRDALPDFYLECLEPVEALTVLADDLLRGCPMERGSRLFDDDWDRKYVQGEPVAPPQW